MKGVARPCIDKIISLSKFIDEIIDEFFLL